MATLEDLLTEISDRGWLVNNLFQRSDGVWQANLRSSTHHTEFALGRDAYAALAVAIDRMETAIITPVIPVTSTIAPAVDLRARLGINTVKIGRRI